MFFPFCAIPAIVDAIRICLQLYFIFNFYNLTFTQFFFRFNKFVIFQALHNFLWSVFMAKENLLSYLLMEWLGK